VSGVCCEQTGEQVRLGGPMFRPTDAYEGVLRWGLGLGTDEFQLRLVKGTDQDSLSVADRGAHERVHHLRFPAAEGARHHCELLTHTRAQDAVLGLGQWGGRDRDRGLGARVLTAGARGWDRVRLARDPTAPEKPSGTG